MQQYLAELPADRRTAIAGVRAVILKNIDPVFEEGMQYGMIGYHVPHRVYPAGYHCDPSQPRPFIGAAEVTRRDGAAPRAPQRTRPSRSGCNRGVS